MITVPELLARKQQLLERLQQNPGPYERDQVERLLAEIDAALNSLEDAVPTDR
jgi:C4-dicarboxylate-specific signal transduction histidine kinase